MPALLPATTGTLDDPVNTGVGKASGVLVHTPDLPQKNLSFSNQGMQEFYERCRALASDQTSEFWHTFGDVIRIAYWDGRNGNPGLYMPGSYAAAAWRAGKDDRKEHGGLLSWVDSVLKVLAIGISFGNAYKAEKSNGYTTQTHCKMENTDTDTAARGGTGPAPLQLS
jgi:hypothetical protein